MRFTKNVLITAGATRNPIDAVRFISAHSTGNTGVFLAKSLQYEGANVFLLGSPEACLRAGSEVPSEEYTSTHDLMDKMRRWVLQNPLGVILHAAAVGDYEVGADNASKIPSGKASLTLELIPTPKIVQHIRQWDFEGMLVTFKAAAPEVNMEDLIAIAQAQRDKTSSDLVFANVLGHLDTLIAIVGNSVQTFDEREEALKELVLRVIEK